MSRKKKLLSTTILLLLLALIAAILSFGSFPLSVGGSSENTSNSEIETSSPQNPQGPTFVVPESPAGILGAISAFAAGLSVVALKHKKTK